jgi:hypothetical protein
MTSRELFIALVIAVLLGGAFIGVLAVIGDDPAPVPTRRGFTATASPTPQYDHYLYVPVPLHENWLIEDSLGLGS